MSAAAMFCEQHPDVRPCSREDLEDLLADPTYFQAIFHSLTRVKNLHRAQAELGMANESIASRLSFCKFGSMVAYCRYSQRTI